VQWPALLRSRLSDSHRSDGHSAVLLSEWQPSAPETAAVAVLAPICVEKFQHQADAPAKLIEFNKISSWNRRSVIEKGGWATMPGSDAPNSAVASACAEKLGSLT